MSAPPPPRPWALQCWESSAPPPARFFRFQLAGPEPEAFREHPGNRGGIYPPCGLQWPPEPPGLTCEMQAPPAPPPGLCEDR